MLNPSVVKELKRIVRPENVLTAPEELHVYSYDATRLESGPWAVIRPLSSLEIAELVVVANREHIPIVPRGAGTGMSGGSVPVHGGIVLSLERMNRIIEIDAKELVAVVEPGVVTGDLQREVESMGLFYPPDPASSAFCTLGGNIAECAGGLRAVKYGVTKDYVLGLELVLPAGEIIRTGGRTVKSVAGYDLTKLIVGSEGTLGVVTGAILRLLPLPESVRTLSAFFDTIEDAANAATEVILGRIVPRALEIADRGALRAVESYLNEDFSQGASAMLLVEVDGTFQSTSNEIIQVRQIMADYRATRILTAETDAERERLWKMRRAISPALYTLKRRKLNEDIVVPRSRVGEMLRSIDAVAERYGLLIVNFGHAGDGNIHTNIMVDDADFEKAESAATEILEATVRLGGSISGEHGIGITKRNFLPLEIGPDAMNTMKKIKRALDPNNIMNPGKIFLDSL